MGSASVVTATRLFHRSTRCPTPSGAAPIDRVIVDVSGDHFVDYEKEVLAYIARD
jgi:hypothetical protein